MRVCVCACVRVQTRQPTIIMKCTALALGMLAVTDAIELKPKPSLLKLRGGLGGIDATQVGTAVSVLNMANAGVMSLAPEKAGEMYGVAETKMTSFFAQWSGLMMFAQSLAVYLALKDGKSLAEGLGWGFLPSCVASVQDFLNDRMVGSLGMSQASKYMPAIVNVLLTLGLLGKLSFMDADLTMKVLAGWLGANGLFGYVATDAWMEGWGGSVSGAAETGMAKLMASTMMAGAALAGASALLGKSALESFGAAMGVYALTQIDSMYISKSLEAMGVDANKGLFWLVIQLATVAVIFA